MPGHPLLFACILLVMPTPLSLQMLITLTYGLIHRTFLFQPPVLLHDIVALTSKLMCNVIQLLRR